MVENFNQRPVRSAWNFSLWTKRTTMIKKNKYLSGITAISRGLAILIGLAALLGGSTPVQAQSYQDYVARSGSNRAHSLSETSSSAASGQMLAPPPEPAPTRPALYENSERQGPPAWAQEPFDRSADFLQPFGANLFSGNFSKTYYDDLNHNYEVTPGDRVSVRMWGAHSFDEVLVVDQQGNLFLPGVGPVGVAGLPQNRLTAAVKAKISTVYTSNVDVYVNLLNAQPVAVYVTGFVNKPGRYAGGPTESPLYYLDMAGGINIAQGSYRHLTIRRGRSDLAVMDLYDFILKGSRPDIRLQEGDTIIVGKKGIAVAAIGRLAEPALYELTGPKPVGAHLMRYAAPLNSVTNVSISGVRGREPFRKYMNLREFAGFSLADNDTVEFHADVTTDTIMVNVTGAAKGGATRHSLRKGTTLAEFLRHVPVDENVADWPSVYLKRQRVAEQQRKAILESLKRLEHSALTATSGSVDEANIRVREAELVQDFVRRASIVQPNGTVVVSHRGRISNMMLEDGDIVVIPQKNSVVTISGEVMMPNAVAWDGSMRLPDYIAGAGGFTDRADRNSILVVKPNGEVGGVKKLGLGPGDRLLVMPSYDSKNMQLFKDMSQILYQIAIAAGVAIDVIRN